ncbi:MAG: hypothetical protein ACOX0F_03560 [Syntrophomonadaceae bacterium]|jgi:ABC-type iron transport system FetAB ATPase subunit
MANFDYRYTTGPISVSENSNNVRILALNNGQREHQARVIIYDLNPIPKTLLLDETFTIAPKSKNDIEFITNFNYYEVQVQTNSSMVYFWIAGRAGNENLVGNVFLHKDLIKI